MIIISFFDPVLTSRPGGHLRAGDQMGKHGMQTAGLNQYLTRVLWEQNKNIYTSYHKISNCKTVTQSDPNTADSISMHFISQMTDAPYLFLSGVGENAVGYYRCGVTFVVQA